jgi:transcriptional antiterminator NusG
MRLVDPAKTWFVVRSAVRQEERAANAIRLAGFDVYLPTMRIEKKHRRTNTYSEVERPLMTGYLFVGFTSFAKHFGMIAKCDGVYDFVKVQGEPIPVSANDVIAIQVAEMDMRFDDTRAARIHRKEEAKTRKLTTEMKYPPGKDVVVSDAKHPFADFHAVVDEVTKSGNIRALITLFGRAVAVEFEAGQLQPAA